VVHGKGSLLAKMPGDDWQQFANLRLLFGLQFATPGKKLLFMGDEFAQRQEWHHDDALDWHLLEHPAHAGVCRWVADLNALYRSVPGLHEGDHDPAGFEWVLVDEAEVSLAAFLRRAANGDPVLAAFNFTPVPRENVLLGVPEGGFWRELANSDGHEYGGSGVGNFGGVEAQPVPWHGRPRALTVTLPPLGCVLFAPERP
jgi:1,4-alpha-glucan branching enzyme